MGVRDLLGRKAVPAGSVVCVVVLLGLAAPCDKDTVPSDCRSGLSGAGSDDGQKDNPCWHIVLRSCYQQGGSNAHAH